MTSLVSLKNVTKTYLRGKQKVEVLHGVDLEIAAGEFVALMGPSGSGKTTMLNLIAGLDKSTSGEVSVAGNRLDQLSRGALSSWRARHIGFIFQFYNLLPVLTAEANVEVPLLLTNLSRAERKQRVRTGLELVGLADRAKHKPGELSGGQQQRVFLARALIGEPELLILDEPTASVDIKTRDDILHLLAELNRQGITIVLTTHELNAVAAHLPYVACVNGGIVAQGSPLDVFTEEILSRTFAADMRVIRDEETGGMLVAEAGRHGPFAEPLFHHTHLHHADIPHDRAALGPDTGLSDHPHNGIFHPREDAFAELAGTSSGRGHGA